MTNEEFTSNYAGYERLSRHLMTALNNELTGSSLSEKSNDEWLYQQLDLVNGQCIKFTRWNGKDDKNPFFLVLCTASNEDSRVLEFDMSNIAYINERYTWYLRQPKNSSSKDFLKAELGSIVNIDDKYRERIKEVKKTLESGVTPPRTGYEFLVSSTLNELTNQFCRLVKLTFDWHDNRIADNGTPEGGRTSFEIENDDLSLYTLAQRRVRQNQGLFKAGLLDRYSGKCVVTGCNIRELLIAAHIQDHAESGVNELDNGLLLKTDIHTLYDSGLLAIEANSSSPTDSLLVTLHKTIRNDLDYKNLHNKVIKFSHTELMPNKKYLAWKKEKHEPSM